MTERWKGYMMHGVETAGGPIPFALSQWAFLFPIFLTIRRTLPSGGKVLDVGCGAGIFASLLAHHGFQVVGIDEDSDIVSYARETATYLHSPVSIEEGNAFDLSRYYGQFDLVYSLGVVEHFEPSVTIEMIREQARCARFVVAVVPTRFTRYAAPVTDERLYYRKQVSAMFRMAGIDVKESFVYGEVPTLAAKNLERFLPGIIYRQIKQIFSYGMGICCVGRSK